MNGARYLFGRIHAIMAQGSKIYMRMQKTRFSASSRSPEAIPAREQPDRGNDIGVMDGWADASTSTALIARDRVEQDMVERGMCVFSFAFSDMAQPGDVTSVHGGAAQRASRECA